MRKLVEDTGSDISIFSAFILRLGKKRLGYSCITKGLVSINSGPQIVRAPRKKSNTTTDGFLLLWAEKIVNIIVFSSKLFVYRETYALVTLMYQRPGKVTSVPLFPPVSQCNCYCDRLQRIPLSPTSRLVFNPLEGSRSYVRRMRNLVKYLSLNLSKGLAVGTPSSTLGLNWSTGFGRNMEGGDPKQKSRRDFFYTLLSTKDHMVRILVAESHSALQAVKSLPDGYKYLYIGVSSWRLNVVEASRGEGDREGSST